jgi:hypothetical protein
MEKQEETIGSLFKIQLAKNDHLQLKPKMAWKIRTLNDETEIGRKLN